MICKSFTECLLIDIRCRIPAITRWKVLKLCLTEARVLAVVLLRIMQYVRPKKFFWRLAPFIRRLNEVMTGLECHLDATVEQGLFLPHTQNIVIGQGVVIKERVTIYNGVSLGASAMGNDKMQPRYPQIGEGVIVYTGAKILGAITIGHNSIVGANSVVLRDVPDNFLAVGVPAKLVKKK